MKPITSNPHGLLDVKDVAERLRLCEKTVRKLIRCGDLEATQPSNKYLVSEAALTRYLKRSKVLRSPRI